MLTTDVVVVGAGAAGSATAWMLARRGKRVVLVDRFPPGHRNGSSHGTERIFRLVYPERHYVRFALEALPLWRELESESGARLLDQCGGIDIGPDSVIESLVTACAGEGVPLRVIEPSEARALAPGLRVAGTLAHQTAGGVTHADRTLEVLQARAEHHGAAIRHGDPVRGIDETSGGVRVTTASGLVVEADTCVVTTGAWAEPVLAGHVALPPITVTKEQVLFFRPTRAHVWPTFIGHGDPLDGGLEMYGLPTPDGLVKVGEHLTGPVVDPDTRTFDPEPAAYDRMVHWARDHLDDVDPDPVGALTCLYASTPDDSFVLDRVGRLVVGVGLGGHGFKFTPAIGSRLADLADGTGWHDNPFALPDP